jgi:ribosomal protein S6
MYKIKKELNGHFMHLVMEAKELVPSDIEKKLLASEDVLRHLLLRSK